MSSLRNAVQRRQHRERAQPAAREKWGILEKHKDYSLRAADYNLKKAKLQRLREKVRDRNPDEFAFGMVSAGSRTQGRHGERDATQSTLSLETVKLLKTQDAGYLRVVGEKVRRQMEQVEKEVRLQNGVKAALGKGKPGDGLDDEDEDEDGAIGGITAKKTGRKVVFVNSVDEQKNLVDGINEDDGDQSEDETVQKDQATAQRKSKKQLEAEARMRREIQAAKKLKKRAAESRLRKLEALKKQYQDIVAAEQELDLQRAKMENSVGGVNKYGVKWKVRERKR
ncbi:hypothetical protein D8B26_002879 [Coccidioides posadasii str. Silveira]|uniref:U3 small nucleolar RNA-associated protein 11 n=3 Tax=Coccidioides posadasii TaxID=199306 RepID=E9CXY1_COCPS|nr:U3 small nucleolar RNA-associated protein Utp11 [Coccidioides posadasii str. Silveira]KMM72633.1 U3 snoRNP-associated protein Utp11 [Coccidioides posadasii RMSCC 3488]QVM08186.1 hypothetical protein D8B26_002879 [Coccidioides posadasii str. Silveira]